MEATAAAAQAVKIRLVTPDGDPVAEQWVTVLDPTGVPREQLQAGRDGIVSVPAQDGNVVLRVGRGVSTPYFVDTRSQPAGRPINVQLTKETRGTVRMYGQVVDKTGQPAAGVGLVIWRKEDKAALATTVSDSNGAFLLTFSAPGILNKTYVLELSVNEDPIPLPDLESVPSGLYGPHVFVCEHRPPRSIMGVAPRPFLIGNEEETLTAFKKAPQLFMRPLSARPPSPCCPYTPGEVATRVYQLNQIVTFPLRTQGPVPFGRLVSNAIDFIDMEVQTPLDQTLRYGALVQYRQEWWDLGFTLGNLLYSVPLAPCEETKIATVDWRRKDYAKRQSALDETFYQDTTISRDEAINEAVRLITNKTVTDSTEGGGGAISLGFIGGGYAKTVETITDTADATTTASRYINDRIQQVSNTLRNTRAFSVVEATQEEESVVRTRVLRNHNHCHTVTFQYFEVLRTFLISTFVEKIRPVLLVPVVAPSFTADLARRYAYVLRRALLDPTLQPTLDALLGVSQTSAAEATQASGGTAITTTGGDGSGPTITAFHVRSVVTATPPLGPNGWQNACSLVVEAGDHGAHALLLEHETPDEEYTYDGAKALPRSPDSRKRPILEWTIHVADIERVGIQNGRYNGSGGSGSDLTFDDLVISVELSDGSTQQLLFEPSWSVPDGRRTVALIRGGTAVQAASSQGVDLTRLLDHLNANMTYYATALITAGDAGLRWLVLSGLNDGRGAVLADIVDNTVAGSIGNYIAFPLTGPEHLPAEYGTLDGSWMANPPEERIVTLPTPGVFAESQLGSCSSCETIDQTRFWDWTKSPCPEEAPPRTTHPRREPPLPGSESGRTPGHSPVATSRFQAHYVRRSLRQNRLPSPSISGRPAPGFFMAASSIW